MSENVTSAADSFGSVVEQFGHRFASLTMIDYGELERAVRAKTIKRVKETLFANGVDKKDHLKHILDIEYQVISLDDVRMYVASDGATLALTLSLVRGGKERAEAEKIAGSIPIWEAVKLALEVSTFNAMFREKLAAQEEYERRQREAAEPKPDSDQTGTGT